MSVNKTASGNWYAQYRIKGTRSPIKEYFGKGKAGKQKAEARYHEVQA
jgi:hypothetical protein